VYAGDADSKDASLKLAAKYKAMNKAREEEIKRQARDLQDLQDLEIGLRNLLYLHCSAIDLSSWCILLGKGKVRVMTETSAQREENKKDKIQSIALKKQYRAQEKERFRFELMGESEQKAVFQEMNEREKAHIQEIKEHKRMQALEEGEYQLLDKCIFLQLTGILFQFTELQAKERQEIELVRIKQLHNNAEMEEIIKRIVEENAMRRCEERRRAVEMRHEYNNHLKKQEMDNKRNAVTAKVDNLTSRVRLGNFVWHHGKYSFYDDIRPKPVEW
jgi:hypothetical protein